MIDQLISGVAEIFEVDPATLRDDTPYKDCPEWDSLAALSLLTLIEDEFGVVLGDKELKRANTLAALAMEIKTLKLAET